jgi:hypothetical protein
MLGAKTSAAPVRDIFGRLREEESAARGDAEAG